MDNKIAMPMNIQLQTNNEPSIDKVHEVDGEIFLLQTILEEEPSIPITPNVGIA